MTRTRTILMSGMFDMHNFGDLMFPLVAQMHLEPRGFRIQPVSATGCKASLVDAPVSLSLPEALTQDCPMDGVLIGGGYIVHGHRLDILREYRAGDTGAWVGPGTWLGATLAGALHDVPVAWNAPGAPHPVGGPSRHLAAPAFAAADYLSVRDLGSRRLLGEGGEHAEIIPDTIVDLPKLWTAKSLEQDFKSMLGRLGLDGDGRILAVHTRGRSLAGEPVTSFAVKLQETCQKLDLTPVFVGLGSAHNDHAIATALHEAMTIQSAALNTPTSLREIAALLAHAQAYVGSSLHGYVGAYSYNRPAVLVARPSYQKFRGFIDHVQRPGDMAKSWDQALAQLPKATAPGAPPTTLTDTLTLHWNRIADCFHQGPAPGRAARMTFLRQYVSAGIRQGGTGWPFLPFTTQQNLEAALSGDDVRDKEPI